MEPWYNKWSSDIQARRQQLENNIEKLNVLQCHSHFRTEQLIYVSLGSLAAYIVQRNTSCSVLKCEWHSNRHTETLR